MIATYLLDENELDESFYQQLKQQFRNKRISITISEAIDETDYLLANAANAKRLLESIDNSKKEGGLVKIDLEKLKEQIGE
jgi:hypothetical protein